MWYSHSRNHYEIVDSNDLSADPIHIEAAFMVTALVRDGKIVARTVCPTGPLGYGEVTSRAHLGSSPAASSADDSDAGSTRTR